MTDSVKEYFLKNNYSAVIPGHAGGQGYDPLQPPDPMVVMYELYVVETPPLSSQNSRGPCLAMVLLQNIIKELTPNANAFSALDVVF